MLRERDKMWVRERDHGGAGMCAQQGCGIWAFGRALLGKAKKTAISQFA